MDQQPGSGGIPGVPTFESVEQRFHRLSATYPYAVHLEDFTHFLSHEPLDWIEHLAMPCLVPAFMESDDQFLRLVIGPPRETRAPDWTRVDVIFDKSGKWVDTHLENLPSGRSLSLVPHPNFGFLAAEAAAMVGVQLEFGSGNLRPSWISWRVSRENPHAGRDALDADRAACLSRLRNSLLSRQVRLRALEGVAQMHPDDFQATLNAEAIMSALSSDWHPVL